MIHLDKLLQFQADRERISPNQGMRTARGISLIILHATADNGNEVGAEQWMTNEKAKASAHLHIRRDGTVTRHVADNRRAWHAGQSSWPNVADVNSASLGWEIANKNDGKEPYTEEQYATVGKLLRYYLPQGIEREDVLSHALISPERKTDPLGWDWDRMWWEMDQLNPPPNVVAHYGASLPPRAPLEALDLNKISIPTREHIEEIGRSRNIPREVLLPGVQAAEVLLRGILAARVGGSMQVMKMAADALADFAKRAA